MPGTMPIGKRNAAWKRLREVAQRCVDTASAMKRSLNNTQKKTVARAKRKAREQLVKVWRMFPETRYNRVSKIPPPETILASLDRQDKKAAQASYAAGFVAACKAPQKVMP